MTIQKVLRYIKVLALIGLGLSIYLLWQYFFRPPFQPCYINSLVNCDAIVSGAVAKTFGIPTALYGFIGYIVILFAAITARKKLLLGMSAFGLVFCLSIAYIELFQLHVVCPVCIGCQLVMISIFSLAVWLNKTFLKTMVKSGHE